MAETAAKTSGGGFSRFVLWLLIAVLLAAVWYLASERNQRRFHVVAQNGAVIIERGRFFPTGTAPSRDKAYGPVAIPNGEKAPGELDFDDQNALDRYLFDLLATWVRSLSKKGDTHAAAALVERASGLPGLTGAQVQQLGALSADLSWDDAQTDLASAVQLLGGVRRKLAAVQAGKGSHTLEAAALDQGLQGVQRLLEGLTKPAK
jgi:hypothetical protein